jgi:hypothetical protein
MSGREMRIRFYIPEEDTGNTCAEDYETEGYGGTGYKVKRIIGCEDNLVEIEHLDGSSQVFHGFPFVLTSAKEGDA